MNEWKLKWMRKEQEIRRMQKKKIDCFSEYQGNWKDWKRNGLGILSWNDGNKYEGEWKDDKFHGKGRLCEKNGDIYEG